MGCCGGRAGACGRMRTLGASCPPKSVLSRHIVLPSRSGVRPGSIGTIGLAMSGANGKGGEEGGDARGAAEEAPVKLEGKSVGIDLGTSNSAVAAIIDGKPAIIPNSLGKRTTPSVVALVPREGGSEEDFDIIVGEAALAMDGQKNVFSSVKRVIGRSFDEARKIATGSLHRALFDEFGEDLQLRAPILKGTVKPEEVSSHVVKQLISDAERHLGEKVTRAVITVPAYFTDKQREATEAAGMLAGLEKVKLLREPEAAALAYGLDKLEDELILVFDLGGGTLDVSVLEVGGGIIEVIWTGGDNQLGGDDFDKEVG
jgi:molecular chaperone DnaK